MHGYQRLATEGHGIPLQDWTNVSSSTDLQRKPSFYRLSPYFFLSSLAWGLTMVPRVNVLVMLVCHQKASGADAPADCASPQVLAGVSFLSTYRDLLTGLLGAVMSVVLGQLSDRVGRVKILAFNGLGLLAGELVLLLIVAFPRTVDDRWLYAAFALDGLSGSLPLLLASTAAYVADTTSDHARVLAMGWLQGGMFLGMAGGPALGTALSQWTPDRPAAVFVWALLCHGAALVTLLWLPESRKVPKGEVEGQAVFFSRATFLPVPLHILFQAGHQRRRLVLLFTVTVVLFGCAVGSMDVLLLYPQARFHWNMFVTGNFVALVSLCRAMVATLVLRLLLRLFTGRWNDAVDVSPDCGHPLHAPSAQAADPTAQRAHLALLRLALCTDLLGFVGFGVAPSGAFFVAAGVLASLSALGVSAIQASLSMLVPPAHVGALLGLVGSVQALAQVVAPPAVHLLYGWTVAVLPQAVFFGLAAATAVGLALMMLW